MTWTELCEKQSATLKLDGKQRLLACVPRWTVDAEPAGWIDPRRKETDLKRRCCETGSKTVALGGVRTLMQMLLGHSPKPGPEAWTNYHNKGTKFNQTHQLRRELQRAEQTRACQKETGTRHVHEGGGTQVRAI